MGQIRLGWEVAFWEHEPERATGVPDEETPPVFKIIFIGAPRQTPPGIPTGEFDPFAGQDNLLRRSVLPLPAPGDECSYKNPGHQHWSNRREHDHFHLQRRVHSIGWGSGQQVHHQKNRKKRRWRKPYRTEVRTAYFHRPHPPEQWQTGTREPTNYIVAADST